MKRILSSFLALALVLSLSACGGQTGAAGPEAGSASAASAGQEPAPAPTERPEPIDPASVTVEPQVLAEWDDFTASVTGLEWDAEMEGYRVHISFENNTGDALTLSTSVAAVNWDEGVEGKWETGSENSAYMADVPAGTSENTLLLT